MLKKDYVFICFKIFALIQQLMLNIFYTVSCLLITDLCHILNKSFQSFSLHRSNNFKSLF